MSAEQPGSHEVGTVAFDVVFAEELRGHVGARRFGATRPPELAAKLTPEGALDLGLTGLALSGGGIRSAAFNLGLLQALADRGVLPKCDYLSTVSGGGYIGAALTSLCSQTGAGVGEQAGAFRSAPDGTEPPEVSHIRQHGSYLALRRGLLRIDTWRMISAYVSGLLLVLLTVATLLGVVALIGFSVGDEIVLQDIEQRGRAALWMALVEKRLSDFDPERVRDGQLRDAFITWATGFREIVREERLAKDLTTWIAEAEQLPRSRLRDQIDVWLFACRRYTKDRERLWEALFRTISPKDQYELMKKIGVFDEETLRKWWMSFPNQMAIIDLNRFDDEKLQDVVSEWKERFEAATGRKAFLQPGDLRKAVQIWLHNNDAESWSAHFFEAYKIDVVPVEEVRRELCASVWRHPFAFARSLLLIPAGALGFWAFFGALYLVASVLPWKSLVLGLRKALTRAMGYALVTTAVLAVILCGPFFYAAAEWFGFRLREIVGVSTLVSLISVVTSLHAGAKGETGRMIRRFAFGIGAWVLVALFCFTIVFLVLKQLIHSQQIGMWLLARGLNVLAMLVLVTDINRVSLLYFYRDRLADAFIIQRPQQTEKRSPPPVEEGAPDGLAPKGEQVRRLAHALFRGLHSLGAWPFVALAFVTIIYLYRNGSIVALLVIVMSVLVLVLTGGFAALSNRYKRLLCKSDALADVRGRERAQQIVPNDDLRLTDLAKQTWDGPYPLINTAVNLAGSEDLRLRGRKADFFVLSPLYCGSGVTGYVPTDRFERSLDNLATAMAVSGAATNPLLGRGTRPAFAFLLTLLNLRLGMWVQNPKYVRCRQGLHRWVMEAVLHIRRWWPYYIVKELLGKSDEKARHINLSDGGHIENLGVFELLRRKCRVIIASDAGADPDCAFGDLGDLIRMARVDLGVEIRGIDVGELRPSASRHLSESHAIVGEIVYHGKQGATQRGALIYVKSALTAQDPLDLHAYKHRQPRFPHETTIDQFFNEEQFEAYRVLGHRSGQAAADLLGAL